MKLNINNYQKKAKEYSIKLINNDERFKDVSEENKEALASMATTIATIGKILSFCKENHLTQKETIEVLKHLED